MTAPGQADPGGVTRWGFLGAGFVASTALAPAVHAATGSVLQAVAARDARRAEALGPRTVHGGYAALLDDPEVDVVYISLTNEQHLPWTLRALAAGKHVLCEKPLGLTGDEVRQMTEAADASNRILVEAGWYRWHPRTRRAEQLVRSGALGRLSALEATFRFGGVPDGNYRLDPARGGGALLDVGWYVSNALAWALPGDSPVSVRTTTRRAPGGVDASVDATIALASGCLARLSAGIDNPEDQVLVVGGDDGTVRLPRPDAFTSWHQPSSLRWTDDEGAHVEEFEPADPYRLMVESVGERVHGVQPGWLPDSAETLRTASLMDQLRASMQ